MLKKKFSLLVIVSLLGSIVLLAPVAYTKRWFKPQTEHPKTEQLQQAPQDTTQNDQSFEFTADESNTTALSATQKRATVQVKQYDFGAMVEAINGKQGDQKHYWALYINGEYAKTGADTTTLKTGDVVKWVFEEVQ